MKVLVVTSIHPDFDARVWRHATSLAAAGLEVFLICPWQIQTGSIIDGVQLITFTKVKGRLSRLFKLIYRMSPLIIKMVQHVDVIHFHDIDLLPMMMLVRLFKPVIYDVHENYPDEMLVRHWVPGFLRKPLYWLVRTGQYFAALVVRNIVLVVPTQEKDFPKGSLTNRAIIRNFGSVALLQHVKRDYIQRHRRIAFIGSQYPENGTFLVLDIATRLKSMGVEAEFICSDRFGSPAVRSELLRRIQGMGLEDCVRLVPNVPPPEIITILNRARVGLLVNLRVPKQEKALPTKLFEYMAAGLPVVASDLPIIKNYIEESGCGILARPEEPESFAIAIKQLLDDETMALEMGRRGQTMFKSNYSWESQVPALLSYYTEIVER